MKRILLNISLALALGFSISSCNDWLDGVEQTSTVSDEIVWQDEAYVDKYVNAFYTYLHKYGQFGEAQFSGSLTVTLPIRMLSVRTDAVTTSGIRIWLTVISVR